MPFRRAPIAEQLFLLTTVAKDFFIDPFFVGFAPAPTGASLLFLQTNDLTHYETWSGFGQLEEARAAPPSVMIESGESLGFDFTHVYGLTEVYGPAAVCAKQPEWSAFSAAERARLNARQGMAMISQEAMCVLDPETMLPVPADGETVGEIMFRGNAKMSGYLKNTDATDAAFIGGWFHTGDMAVLNPDGYARITDRSKDVSISGEENVSSLEVEDVLHQHPAADYRQRRHLLRKVRKLVDRVRAELGPALDPGSRGLPAEAEYEKPDGAGLTLSGT